MQWTQSSPPNSGALPVASPQGAPLVRSPGVPPPTSEPFPNDGNTNKKMPISWKSLYGEEIRPKPNGLTWPPDPLQVIAWISIVIDIVLFFMLYTTVLRGAAQIALTLIYCVLIIIVVSVMVTLSLSENVDDALFGPKVADDVLLNAEACPQGKKACNYCRVFVTKGAKHCAVCDKCVVGFDHHCRWLNTCIGVKNYHLFFFFMLVVGASMLLELGTGIGVFIDACIHFDRYGGYLRSAYGVGSVSAFLVFVALLMVFNLATLFALSNLLMFHIYLYFSDQSTYAWIKKRRIKKANKKKQLAERHAAQQTTPNLIPPTAFTTPNTEPFPTSGFAPPVPPSYTPDGTNGVTEVMESMVSTVGGTQVEVRRTPRASSA